MKKKLKELAELVGGAVIGDEEVEISGVASLDEAQPGQITFIAHPKYLRKLAGPLEKAGLIKSMQGIYGGYELGKSPEEINIRMILDAYHEQLSWTDCVLGKKCELRDSCQAKQVWEMLEKTLQMHFLPISIRDILDNKVR